MTRPAKSRPGSATKPCCASVGSPRVTARQATAFACCFKALADPTRIRILNLLAANKDAVCVCDIVRHFAIGQPTVSHHLKVLRTVRFVNAERRGTFMYYRVNPQCLSEFPNAAKLIMNR
jgi:ArsR family transcriptional regulator